MSTSGELLFLLCGLVAVVSAVLTVTMRTPLRAAISLLVHVVSLAGLYLTLHAHLLAAIQMIVYAGAIVVLFVFVIMLMGPGHMDSRVDTRGWVLKTLGAGMIVLITGAIAFNVGEATRETIDLPACASGQAECDQFGGVNALGHAIFADAAIPFELVSILLLVAVIAAIAVARGRTDDEKKTIDDLESRKVAHRPFANDPAAPRLNPAVPSIPEEPGAPSAAD